jgi:ABC-type nitrate/sulfonate/bicarbonate transport system permease component
MIRQPISTRTKLVLGVVSICLVLVVYSVLSYRQYRVNPKQTVLPGVSQFFEGFRALTTRDRSGDVWLWEDLWATYSRLCYGIVVGVALSFVVGVAMGVYPPAGAFFEPVVSFFAKIPPTAMLPVYFVLFGTALKMFVAMIALGTFFTLVQAIYQAAKKDVADHAIDKAYSLGASSLEVIWEVVCRQILPRIIENVRLQIGPAMVFLIAAELLVADVGMGYRIRIESRLTHMNVVYIYLLILGASGLLFDWLLTLVRRKLCPWFGE